MAEVERRYRGPSDGILFVASASDTGGIGTVSGKVEVSGDNHVKLIWEMKLIWESTAEAQLDSWLK